MPVVSGVMEQRVPSSHLWNGLGLRIASAIALVGVAWIFVGAGGIAFCGLVILAALLMMKEWEALTERQMPLLQYFGYPYIILPCSSLIWLRSVSIPSDPGLGFALCVALISVISVTDIAAYFTGKRLGRHKLAPLISPNKTWEGSLGGIIAASIIGQMLAPALQLPYPALSVLAVSVLVSLLAQLGDLFKSWVKRLAGVKDSGTLLPGHGGLIDRFDGYMFATPILALTIHYAIGI